MTKFIPSKLPQLAEILLDNLENSVSVRGSKDFSDEDFLTLHSIFGSVLQRALDIFEKQPKLILYKTSNKARSLVEIQGENNRCYRVFPKIIFCPCQAFKHQVIERKSQVVCKHILAARLAQIFGKIDEQEVSQDQYLMLVRSIFNLHKEENG